MKNWLRIRSRQLGAALATPLAASALVLAGLTPASAAADVHQRTYLALGDSLAFGYQQAKFDELLPGEDPAAFDTGYVDDFGRFLVKTHRDAAVVNDGCPGETTDSFIEGPCKYQLAFALHHPYAGGPSASQLSDALAYLSANRGTVSPITLDIGANDALGVIEGTCKLQSGCIQEHAPALFAHVATNLGTILTDLRGAAPTANIVVLGLYNPFGSTIAGGDELTRALNEVIRGVAGVAGARFADPLPVFNPPGAAEQPRICLLTNMCTPLTDVHPTDLGYAVLAGLILRQYLPSSPSRP
ncbi:MAG TPA: SGNH/GDSL hydrolase family protein [Solirubrobacteraceae bacterium]|jgi:lysophospholipase L1-like esterase|nr:SGNH/GDSL hydrolase family protein [Solirubrobacteraceae bacterium]